MLRLETLGCFTPASAGSNFAGWRSHPFFLCRFCFVLHRVVLVTLFACVHCVLCFCVSLSLLPCSWEQIVYGSADATPPLRSNGCIVQLLQFVIIYGGRCSGCVVDVPWMFNTVTKSWSRLPSAVIQTSSASFPIPRMQHGCALLPTPGDGTHLSASLYVIGGRGTQSVRRTVFLLASPPF